MYSMQADSDSSFGGGRRGGGISNKQDATNQMLSNFNLTDLINSSTQAILSTIHRLYTCHHLRCFIVVQINAVQAFL